MFRHAAMILGTICAVSAMPAKAEEVLLLGEESQAVVSGVITDISFNRFVMEHQGSEITVSTQELEIGAMNGLDDLLSEGMAVTVEGEMEQGGVLAARRIYASNNGNQ